MLTYQTIVSIEKHVLPQSGAVAFRIASGENSDTNPPHTVFVLHGLNSRKERLLDVCLRLAQAGFAAVALDAALHGERATDETRYLADLNAPEFIPAFTHVVLQTVDDIAHFATEWGLQTYGLIGHSMGGFLALHTLLADSRADAAVVVGGALDVGMAGTNEADPVYRAAEFAGRAVLLLHGVNDTVVPVAGARKLHTALRPYYEEADATRLSLVELPGVGHEWTEAIADEAVAWMTRHLKNTP